MAGTASGILVSENQVNALPQRQSVLVLENVSKTFGRIQAVNKVSLSVAAGEIHCLLGENGAGKSTLCNLIFGVHQPDSGSMEFDGTAHAPRDPGEALRAGIAMVHQHFSLVPDMTVADNILLGRKEIILERRAYSRKIRDLGASYGLDIDPGATVENLSVGERQRVEIIKCLIRSPKLLILDEPTAVLLPEEIGKLLDVCRNVAGRGCAIVLVTHKLAEIKQVADTVTVLRQGQSVARSNHPERDIKELVSAMVGRDLASLDSIMSSSIGLADGGDTKAVEHRRERGREVLQIDGLVVGDANNVRRVDNVTLTVDRGEIVGVAGVEGNGQTELGLVLAGLLKPSEGRVFIGGKEATHLAPREITELGAGIIPEDRHAVGSITEMSVAENIFLNRLDWFRRFGLLDRRKLEDEATVLMRRFDVRADGPKAPFSSLSGGNQQKAILARELTTRNLIFLLAAQPTRGLDVGAVEAVYKSIRSACDAGAGVLLISSELDELIAVADRIVILYRGRIIGERRAQAKVREEIGMLMAGHEL
ncbi:MAG: ABC transporter ATP-binding protein [Rhodomicrobium sp.]